MSRADLEPEDYARDGQMLPYVGVVEDVADPMQIGRVRVRAIGYHSEKAEGSIPTEHLPWAYVMLPTTASGMSGVGSTHGLVDGSWVFGFFLDGRDAQQPIVCGSFAGAPGLTPMQQDIVGANMGVSSVAAGPMGGYFQTALASVIGGLGMPTRFGATVGGLLNLANFLKNSDALKVLDQVEQVNDTSGALRGQQPAMTKVMDRATVSDITKAVAQTTSVFPATPGLGVSAVMQGVDVVSKLFALGGTGGLTSAGGGSPLSAASFGNVGPAGSEMTANTAALSVRTNYDELVGSAPETTGSLVVHGTGQSKHATYTVDAFRKTQTNSAESNSPDLSQYDYVIDQTGQVIKATKASATEKATKGGSYSVGGQSAAALSVALVGGRNGNSRDGRGPIESLYWPVQLQALQKLSEAFLRRFPQAAIVGAGEVGAGSTGFNVSEWARTVFGNAANAPQGGVQRVTGSGTDNAGPTDADPTTGGSAASFKKSTVANDVGGKPRGFMGGPSHPSPAYAMRRESDVPAFARSNGLTTGRGVASTDAAQGGPGNQYMAVQAEPAQYRFKVAREADSLDARAIPATWNVPEYPHGGEYGRTHVVRSTEAGHHIMLDDTPGRQKVEIMHGSGSMIQVQSDGSGLFYIKKDGYTVVVGDNNIGVHGNMNITVGGSMKVSVEGDLIYDVTGKILFNGASDMTELIRGDRATVTEGSHLFQAKKNAVHKVGKDMTTAVGGKASRVVRGNSDDSVSGNRHTTTQQDHNEFTAGNKNNLTLQSQATHAANIMTQTTGELIQTSKGGTTMSAKGKMTMVSDGNLHAESKADVQIKSGAKTGVDAASSLDVISGTTTHVEAGGAMSLKTGARMAIQSSGATDIKAGGAINEDGTTINLNSGLAGDAADASNVSAIATVNVETPPANLAADGNPASSDGNLDSEQVTQGEMDASEAQCDGSETAGGSGGDGGGGGGGGDGGGGDGSFSEANLGTQLTGDDPLGNFKDDGCAIAQMLVDKGWSKEGAATMVGNMINESSLNPNIGGDQGNSFGLVQWNGARKNELIQYAAANGLDHRTREGQLAFLDYEARGSQAGNGGAQLISGGDFLQVLRAGASYERYVGWQGGSEFDERAKAAASIYKQCFGGDPSTASSGSGAPSGYSGGSSNPQNNATDATAALGGGTGQGDIAPGTNVKGAYAEGGTSGGIDWGQKISPNFTLGQLCPTSKFHVGMNASGSGMLSHDQIIRNLSVVAMNVCEPLLARFGRVTIMSGYRSLAYNNALRAKGKGAAKNSDHMKGQSVDVKIPGVAPATVAAWVDANLDASGVGRYPTFTHVSFYEGGSRGRKRHWGHN